MIEEMNKGRVRCCCCVRTGSEDGVDVDGLDVVPGRGQFGEEVGQLLR